MCSSSLKTGVFCSERRFAQDSLERVHSLKSLRSSFSWQESPQGQGHKRTPPGLCRPAEPVPNSPTRAAEDEAACPDIATARQRFGAGNGSLQSSARAAAGLLHGTLWAGESGAAAPRSGSVSLGLSRCLAPAAERISSDPRGIRGLGAPAALPERLLRSRYPSILDQSFQERNEGRKTSPRPSCSTTLFSYEQPEDKKFLGH